MRIRHLFAAGLLLLASGGASAAVARNLYEASIPVPDQGAEARGNALRAALQTVLVRVTGARPLAAEAVPLLSRSSELVQGYGYEATPGGTGLRLKAQFDSRAVDAALRAAGLPVWGSLRPYVIAWIAVRDERSVVDAASPHAGPVIAAADGRGVPLSLPAQDAAERQSIGFAKVWDADYPAIREASRKYAPDAVVVGRIERAGGGYAGRWALLENGGAIEEWTESRDSLDAALVAGMETLADREASRFAVQTGRAQELRVSVANVQSAKDYGRTLNYLRSLGAVRGAQVEMAQADRLTFRLRIEGDPAGLSRMIGAGNVLRPEAEAPPGVDQSYALVSQ